MDMVKDTQDRIAAEMRDVASRTGDRTSRLRLERWADLLSSLPPVPNPDPRCPKCGFTMCQQFDEQAVSALASIATPNGYYRCYHCSGVRAAEPTAQYPPPVDAKEWTCRQCGKDCLFCACPSAAPSAGPDLREQIEQLPRWAPMANDDPLLGAEAWMERAGIGNYVKLSDVLALVADAKE